MRYIIFLVFLPLLCLNCSNKKRFGEEIFEGYIYDSINGAPARGVTISVDACVPRDGRDFCSTFEFGTTISDNNGYFKIEGKPARSGRYFINAPGNPMIETRYLKSFDQRNIKLYIYK